MKKEYLIVRYETESGIHFTKITWNAEETPIQMLSDSARKVRIIKKVLEFGRVGIYFKAQFLVWSWEKFGILSFVKVEERTSEVLKIDR